MAVSYTIVEQIYFCDDGRKRVSSDPSCCMDRVIFNALSAALQADSVDFKLRILLVFPFKVERKQLPCKMKLHTMEGLALFITMLKLLPQASYVTIMFICLYRAPDYASVTRTHSLFMGCCLSLHLLTNCSPGSVWRAAMVTDSLTRAEQRLMTHSQIYRALCWTAAKWLCLSLWGNSLLTIMLTVAIG